ncbi:MAG: hypothetical protein ACE3JQ_02920 [Paenisporosarcina sp.]
MIMIVLFATVFFGFFGIICFHYAFKAYKSDDEDYLDLFIFDFFEVLSLIFIIILWVSKKLFPRHDILVFRIIVFINGLLMLMIIAIFWFLYLNESMLD